MKSRSNTRGGLHQGRPKPAGGPVVRPSRDSGGQNEIAIMPWLPPVFRLPSLPPPRYVRQSPHNLADIPFSYDYPTLGKRRRTLTFHPKEFLKKEATMSANDESQFFFKIAGVCTVLLIAIPIIGWILTTFHRVDWQFVGHICMVLGVGIVAALAIGFIIDIVKQK